jgi:hypothetical protein
MRAAHTLLLCSALSLPATYAHAQPPEAPDNERSDQPAEDPFSRAQRQRFYDQSQRSHTRALGYSLLLPGLGNIYADQRFTGALLMSSLALTLVALTYGLANDDPQIITIGGIATGGIYATGAITSYYGVSAYNQQLRIRYNLAQQPTLMLPMLSWSF